MTNYNGYKNTVGELGRVWFDKDGALCELITVEEAAKELGYSERHVRRLCDEGQLIAIKINRYWLIEMPSLDFVRNRVEPITF